jgi:hypothetical protein
MNGNPKSNLPPRPEFFINQRVQLVGINMVRTIRGCDAVTVLKCVEDATRPNFLRWVFNVAVKPAGIRHLRFWKDELGGTVDKFADPKTVIEKILGDRRSIPRGELAARWSLSRVTISRLVRAGELVEVAGRKGQARELTRASLAAFLKRRLQ